MLSALVTGATGAIGISLVHALLAAKWRVRTLSRTTSPKLNIEHIQGDLLDESLIKGAVEGIDVVFHLAALLHIENPSPALEASYYRINTDATEQLAQAAYAAGVGRFVFFSTVKVYGTRSKHPIDESHSTSPLSVYAKSKLLAEQQLQAVGIPWTVLRLSPVYGPRMKGSWARMMRAIERGFFLPVGNLTNVHSLSHVDDVVQAAIFAATHSESSDQTYNLVTQETPSMQQILQAMYASVGRPMPELRLPVPLILGAVSVADGLLGLIGKRSPVSRTAMIQLVDDEAYSGQKLRSLGFQPTVSIDEGWRYSRYDHPLRSR